MTDRSDLTRMIRQASTGQEVAQAVAALDEFDRQAVARSHADRETDLGARIAAQRLTPVPIHEHHTAATDWLGDYDPSGRILDYRTAMIAEATTWYRSLDPAVRADRDELAAQASGRARTLGSAYAAKAGAAEREFMSVVGYLRSREGGSGLPQIDQTIDANNAPAPTPYPTEVFPTFGADQDPFNQVERFDHDSQASSQRAPLIQQVMQQQNSGSGFGSGPERPDSHTTMFDTADSYAEVPLGPPGTLPTAPAATDSMASSHPNPVAGVPQDAGAERRVASYGYSAPDPFGYRWGMATAEVMHPFHQKCGSAHWPDEACGNFAHTASVAVGYTMDIDQARRAARCEAVGVREGLRVIASSPSPHALGLAHNRVTAAWGQSDRTMDDTAVLHGFMAVVRPVLAELAEVTADSDIGDLIGDATKAVGAATIVPMLASRSCTACKGVDCGDCTNPDCACARHPRGHSRMAASGLAAGGVTEHERESAPHHLPGTDKFPIKGPADVENAKHDIGRTSEPHGEVVRYINEMAKEYHVAPVGG
jgi:hypothetical protein